MCFVKFSYLWERVVGGQIQKPPCDEVSTDLLLVFNINKPTTLLTVPLNLTTVRLVDIYIIYIYIYIYIFTYIHTHIYIIYNTT